MKHPQLWHPAVHALQDLFDRHARIRILIIATSVLVVIDGPAIVRIDEVQVPEFAALIRVGNAGSDAFQKCLGEAVDPSGRDDAADEFVNWRP